MKQVLQNLKTGETLLLTAPAPAVQKGRILINTVTSLISTGTERMLVDFGKSGLIAKARQQPEKVKQVVSKIRTDGLSATFDAVNAKLNQPVPLGYSNVGVVSASGVEGYAIGDRVVSNGPHADVVSVPQNLCAKIPNGVSDEQASFVVPASIGLQGIRLAEPTIGECFVVMGTGLIGLLTVQMLLAHGCRVLAIDFDASKLELARSFGAQVCCLSEGEDSIAAAKLFSHGRGVDGVIITASTKSNDPVSNAAIMCRKRGRIILVGVVGLHLNRSDFYEKELRFQVSCSYGPGRYDPTYEDKGQDYPLGFVRWTEQRNFEAVLDLMEDGKIPTSALITHRFDFEAAKDAYKVLHSDKAALGIVLQYKHEHDSRHSKTITLPQSAALVNTAPGAKAVVGFIGAGNYASRVLIPAFKKAGATLRSLATSGGVNSVIHGSRSGFMNATTDTQSIFQDESINTVAIATQHSSHAQLAIQALDHGKHVFVEKPLALNNDDLNALELAHASSGRLLMVGYNRRFAPQILTMKRLLDAVTGPKVFVFLMNAGAIPGDHWTQDIAVGGGRIIGEACHLIDLMRFLAQSPIVSIQARCIGDTVGEIAEDKAVIVLGFADGSMGTLHYLANGASQFPKERLEVFTAGRTLQLDNFITLKGFNWPGFSKQKLWRQDKGQDACAAAFVSAVSKGDQSPIPVEELFEVARVCISADEMLREQL
jgi:predicted dehydrogenase/threonine dehydrogenase-like Zn-dependent dehydrogenase